MNSDLLFARRWPKSSLSRDISKMDIGSYLAAYNGLKQRPPTRSRDQAYFGGRSGYPSTKGKTNRREEHFAIAMVNAQQVWSLPDGTLFELLDYQVPLKGQRSDREIGKIDLFGLTEHGRAVLVELKVIGHSGGPSDPPTVAFLEGLRYAAIVEANLERISDEILRTFGREMLLELPEIVILGEENWWSRWLSSDQSVAPALEVKAKELAAEIGVSIVFSSLPDTRIEYGARDRAPRLMNLPKTGYAKWLPQSFLREPSKRISDPSSHEGVLQKTWWEYIRSRPAIELDGKDTRGRPPVTAKNKLNHNLMLPDDAKAASEIEKLISPKDRHRHFGSFRSSQALAQSVFGAFKAAGRLDLLAQVQAECGRSAFGKTTIATTLNMEVGVLSMNEPRPTQLDVYLETGEQCVAVECKLCEPHFGSCSLVLPGKSGIPVCDGSFSIQQGRTERCALSEIGVAYWDLITELFYWTRDEDWANCPLLPTYQIVRNALAPWLIAMEMWIRLWAMQCLSTTVGTHPTCSMGLQTLNLGKRFPHAACRD